MFDVPGGSAVKLLKLAAQQGIPVYKINTSNAAQILPQLVLPAEDLADITNAVNAGLDVTVSKTTVNLNNFNGAGYIVLDPVTGAGPYYISGGLAGGVAFMENAWKKYVYNKFLVTQFVRNYVIGWAKSYIGTPYGWGCKDPFFGRTYELCTNKYPISGYFRLDCSGLIAAAYGMAGFPFFHGKTANDQYEYIGTKDFGSYPDPGSAKKADLMFWERTQKDKEGNIVPGKTHVGIYLEPGKWIAAQGNMVNVYTFTPYWSHPDRALGYGSVLKY